jgi:hypothetical protein
VDRITRALGQLLLAVNDGLDPLIETSQSHDLFSHNGCMYVYETIRQFENARAKTQARAVNGAQFTELSAAHIRHLEPRLKCGYALRLTTDREYLLVAEPPGAAGGSSLDARTLDRERTSGARSQMSRRPA